jgi:hypothetical protein
MMSLDLWKRVGNQRLSGAAIALLLLSAGCASAGNAVGGTGGTGVPPGGGTVVSGVNGAAGTPSAGAAGMRGAAGSATATGVAGVTGKAGTSGAAGAAMAAAGATGGMAGTSGAAGTTGAAGSTGTAGSTGSAGSSGAGGCLDGITDYEKDGPFTVMPTTMGAVNFWVPMVPAGCKVPVIHLANGTGATCSAYEPALNRMATHGFLAICYEDPNTGAGDQAIMAFDAAFAKYPDLADHRLGCTGHSQGGQAAFTSLALAEAKYGSSYIYAGLAMEPASGFGTQPTGGTWQSVYGKIMSPMFMFSAVGTDGLVSQAWVQQAYDAMAKTTEVYFWTANGATHIPVPNGEEQEISIPWFRWKLLGDQKACVFFKAIPMTNTKWAEAASENAKPCM